MLDIFYPGTYAVFDDVRTKELGDAFDAVCGQLHGTQHNADYPDRAREAIAQRIIAIACTSPQRGPQKLAAATVASLGIKI